MPEDDPPRKVYDLKPREYDRVNPAAGAVAAPATPVVPAGPVADQPITVADLCQQATVTGPLLAIHHRAAVRENEVHQMLRENVAVENAAGLNALAPRQGRKSRRTRDYIVLMVGCNAVFGTLAVHGYRSGNAVLFVYAMAAIGFVSAAITWVIWGIMEKY